MFRKSTLKRKKEYHKKEDGLGMRVSTQYEKVLKEIAIMKRIERHPNVIQLTEVINDPEQDKIYLVMELAENGEVMSWDDKTIQYKPFIEE